MQWALIWTKITVLHLQAKVVSLLEVMEELIHQLQLVSHSVVLSRDADSTIRTMELSSLAWLYTLMVKQQALQLRERQHKEEQLDQSLGQLMWMQVKTQLVQIIIQIILELLEVSLCQEHVQIYK